MSANNLTETELLSRREAEMGRLRRARATVARLDRQLADADKRRVSQQKFVLGYALLRAVEHEPRHADALRRLLAPHITRDVDRECLRGTPLDFSSEAATPAAPTGGEA